MSRPVVTSLNHMLPTWAWYRGYNLHWESPEIHAQGDPVILSKFGSPGDVLYQWDYIPSMIEVWDKIKELEASGEV